MFTLPLALLLMQAKTVDLDRYVYPLSKPLRAPRITVDVKDAPDMAAWGAKAQKLATDWFPALTSWLATEGYHPPRRLRFVFRNKQDAPAYATGDEISFNAAWIRQHPDDLGMVIHEMTHIVQHYPDNKADTGWLVEGIADYTRWWRYEPEAPRTKINFEKATYHDAYRTTAYFLAWVGKKYDLRLVPALDRALRKGLDPMPLFASTTGKTAEELWKEFAADPMVWKR
ncbi:basic secretory protein-like protein [Fimbriimonas ginsengisoli]|uniref:Basic Secretory Protein n=1 Tax=Fimbriimonas ginsengisoli Gsoil 348 TaxID=661478 RepID=A0A068NQT9_FIMGI|nr:basic secretory protein-like protein [Fimbriimonas ginsengisoli]AIE85747.1 hypothetical protein OP10G_2379 [Fimbriimonas ginsengisoli Gsoil 348]